MPFLLFRSSIVALPPAMTIRACRRETEGWSIQSAANRRPRDPSTNLNGGVIEGVRTLSQQMDRAPVPLHFGTLVVFTDGTDRAHRASAEDVEHALDMQTIAAWSYFFGKMMNRPDASMKTI